MITLFENYTYELTDQEQAQVIPIANLLKTKTGKRNAISNARLVELMYRIGYETDSARMRKIIHFIRVNKLVINLLANSKGYYVAESMAEVKTYVESLKQRENSIRQIRESYGVLL